MHQIAIMKKSWGLLPKIFSGEKSVESRWFKTKHPPWNKIKAGDTLWFKNTGEPVTLKATVTQVLQLENLNKEKTQAILEKYWKVLGLTNDFRHQIPDYFNNKNYCLLVFFEAVQSIKPFEIDKKGFGAMAAWICVDDIGKIKVAS